MAREREKRHRSRPNFRRNATVALEYFSRVFFLFPSFFSYVYVFIYKCMCMCTYVCSSILSHKKNLSDCSDSRCRSPGIERMMLLIDAAVWLHSWLYYCDNRRSRILFLFEILILNFYFWTIAVIDKKNAWIIDNIFPWCLNCDVNYIDNLRIELYKFVF